MGKRLNVENVLASALLKHISMTGAIPTMPRENSASGVMYKRVCSYCVFWPRTSRALGTSPACTLKSPDPSALGLIDRGMFSSASAVSAILAELCPG